MTIRNGHPLSRERIDLIRASLGDGTYTAAELKDFAALCDMARLALWIPVKRHLPALGSMIFTWDGRHIGYDLYARPDWLIDGSLRYTHWKSANPPKSKRQPT